MHKINKITFENFKFFNSQTSINLNEKNLLLYGENGSGKSSIYWGLYTFLQSVFKEKSDVEKYFDPGSDKKLLNIYQAEGENSKIAVEFSENGDNHITKTISYALIDTKDIVQDLSVKNCSIYSDFINFKLLFNHYNFLHRDEIDLFPIFERDILDVVDFGIGLHPISDSAFNRSIDVWNDLNVEHEHEEIPINIIESRKNNIRIEYPALVDLCEGFNNEFNTYLNGLLESINTDFIQRGFGLNIDLRFDYVPAELHKGAQLNDTTFEYTVTSPQIKLKIKTLDTGIPITKPQSFLNEAKLSAIALSIRFATIKDKDVVGTTKILVLDDLLLSLDMNNRHSVIDIVLKEFSDFQLLFMTHDKELFHFMENKIKRKGEAANWKINEMYPCISSNRDKEYPLIIPSEIGNMAKAYKYFESRDYTVCSLYLRKELEKIIIERLPPEVKTTIDGKPHGLEHYWKIFVERYARLGVNITDEIKDNFAQTKLMILNPQAHFNLSSPVYRIELENAFKLIADIEASCPFIKDTILLSKGMELQFKHPSQDYTFDFQLLTDFSISGTESKIEINFPKCQIKTYQYNSVSFWNFRNKSKLEDKIIGSLIERTDILSKVYSNLISIPELSITKEMLNENISLSNGIWTLKEILDKSKISI